MKKQQSSILGGALIVAVFVIMIPIMAYGGVIDKIGDFVSISKRQDKIIDSYQSNMNYYLQKDNEVNYIPRLTPGVLPVDLDTRRVARIIFAMRDTLKPKSPNDVSSVVAFRCWDRQVGTYGSGSPGYQKTCNIWVIDVRTHSWGNVGTLTGTEPPHRKKGYGPATGSHPALDWIRRNGGI